jgi:hypothetical protein
MDDGWQRPDAASSPWTQAPAGPSSAFARPVAASSDYITQDPAQNEYNQFIPNWDFLNDVDWVHSGNAQITARMLKVWSVHYGFGTFVNGSSSVLMLPTAIGDSYTLKCRVFGQDAYDDGGSEFNKLSCNLTWSTPTPGGLNVLSVKRFTGYQEFTLLSGWQSPSTQLQLRFGSAGVASGASLWTGWWWVDWVSMKLAIEVQGEDDPTIYSPEPGVLTPWSPE